MLTAKDIMTRQVITVPPELSVRELATLLLTHKIGGAPVVSGDGKLLGVVTESDLIDQGKNVHIPTVVSILDSFLVLESPHRMDQEFKKMMGRTVGDICAKELVTVTEETPLSDIATIMSEKRVHTLPVVVEGELVGVIGKTDLIRSITQV
jgi:CBS domain-containing protein